MGDIRTHGVVDWYNIRDIVGSRTHPCNTTTSVFVFQTAVAIISRKNEVRQQPSVIYILFMIGSTITIYHR